MPEGAIPDTNEPLEVAEGGPAGVLLGLGFEVGGKVGEEVEAGFLLDLIDTDGKGLPALVLMGLMGEPEADGGGARDGAAAAMDLQDHLVVVVRDREGLVVVGGIGERLDRFIAADGLVDRSRHDIQGIGGRDGGADLILQRVPDALIEGGQLRGAVRPVVGLGAHGTHPVAVRVRDLMAAVVRQPAHGGIAVLHAGLLRLRDLRILVPGASRARTLVARTQDVGRPEGRVPGRVVQDGIVARILPVHRRPGGDQVFAPEGRRGRRCLEPVLVQGGHGGRRGGPEGLHGPVNLFVRTVYEDLHEGHVVIGRAFFQTADVHGKGPAPAARQGRCVRDLPGTDKRRNTGGSSIIEPRPLERRRPGVGSGQGRPCRAYLTRGSGRHCGLFTPGASAG